MKKSTRSDTTPGFVELQLLRHGPPHNQLLSPLTEYLALCDDHPNTTLRFPLEHSALETRLRALRYLDSEPTRIDQLGETSRIASDLLARVPGLIADLSSHHARRSPFVHLSIASRASELALFPFELAVAPDGFPGAGQALCMQKRLPISLTRRSRNVRYDDFAWDRPVKILLIASDAGGEIPILQHYALLRKLVEPWVGSLRVDIPEFELDCKRKLRGVLRLLTRANVDKIERALCDEVDQTGKSFTHIHVLAHGCNLPDSDRRYGIALHHPTKSGEVDAVSGKRLALCLGCLPDYPASSRRYTGPAVVSLATCDSADQGGVAVPGASLAFELHESGVPLVIGSQFPLSSEGSIILTESLYRGFLGGRDPRSIIWEARRALHANLPQSLETNPLIQRSAHDWASMTVYAALPANLDKVLPQHRRAQKRIRLNARLRNIYSLLGTATPEVGEVRFYPQKWRKHFDEAAKKAVSEAQKFEQWMRDHDSGDVEARVSNSGILASAFKQIGLLSLHVAAENLVAELAERTSGERAELPALNEEAEQSTNVDEQVRTDAEQAGFDKAVEFLRKSRDEYWTIFTFARDESWALVQFLCLDFALRAEYDRKLWITALELAKLEENSSDVQRRVWALAALLELQFLHWLSEDFGGGRFTGKAYAARLAKRIAKLSPKAPNEVQSAERQFFRYHIEIAPLASVAKRFPNRSDERYDQQLATASRLGASLQEGEPGYAAVQLIDEVMEVFEGDG